MVDSLEQVLRQPEIRADPYPFYRQLREESPRWLTDQGVLVLSTYGDVDAVLRDQRFSCRVPMATEQFDAIARRLGFGATFDVTKRALPFADPPDHTRIRMSARSAFFPAIDSLRPRIQEIVDELLDLGREGEIDLINELAAPLNFRVMSELLGVPADDHVRLHEWVRVSMRILEPDGDVRELVRSAKVLDAYLDYFRDLVARREGAAGDDLLAALLGCRDHDGSLCDDELLALVSGLYAAGHESTGSLIGNGLLALLRNPGELDRLRQHDDLMPLAVEEMLRYDSSIQVVARFGMVDFELNGMPIEQGQSLQLLLGSANRDPAEFAAADRFDVGRRVNHHLSFAAGIHHCLGARLARYQIEIAVRTLLRRFPVLELLDANPPQKELAVGRRGLSSLRVGVAMRA